MDRVITTISIFFLLASIGITFLFISRIFDTKIGGVTALLMLLCELLWRYSQSGLPQMLMLFLFTLGCYFVYRAVEAQCLDKKPVALLMLGTVCFGLLALSHWMAIWPFMGLVIFSCFYFKPRGAVGLGMLVIFLIIIPAVFSSQYLNIKTSVFLVGFTTTLLLFLTFFYKKLPHPEVLHFHTPS